MTKPFPRRVLATLLGLLLLSVLAPSAARAEMHDHLEVELVTEHLTVEPGGKVMAGIRLAIDEHWHVYWKNPGDSGTPVSIAWELPEGWSASPILWPTPKTLPQGPLVNFGFEGTLVLPIELSVPADAPEGNVDLPAALDWLVCEVGECLPGGTELTLRVVVKQGAPQPGPHKALFEAARAASPKALPTGTSATLRFADGLLHLELKGQGPWSAADAILYVFGETDGVGAKEQHLIDPASAQQVKRAGDLTTVTLKMPKKRRAPPAALRGVLAVETKSGRQAFTLDLPLEGAPAPAPAAPNAPSAPNDPGPAAAAPPGGPGAEEVPPGFEAGPVKGTYTVTVLPTVLTSSGQIVDALAGKTVDAPEEKQSPLWLLLLGALVGGIVLNVMPCVLPVLSIKVLGFVSQADEHPVKVRRHAYAFGVGVIVSFWFLAGLILALRAGGEQLGWGFHFQSPVFVAAMAVLMFAVGMNLAGSFEFGLSVMTLAGDAATKIHASGYASSFWSGALATVIATPCTAPMMGPAVGYAMTAPELHTILVFTFLGIGMALPYVLLSMSPRLLNKMPRPGPWMETFKHALAFPMFATVIWLGFVLADHVGAHGVLWMFMSLLVVGLALWIYGQWGTPSTPTRRRLIVGYGFALLAGLGAWSLMAKALAQKAPELEAPDVESGIPWEKWSRARVAWRLSQGHVVFVDFTAKWCVSCQVNDQTFISTDAVREAIREHNVSMLKADWTRPDAEIRDGLAEFGRSSVPVYLVYRPIRAGAAGQPPGRPVR